MTKYAVAFINLIDNDLQIKIVEGDSWHEALDLAFPGYTENINIEDMEEAKDEAFNQEWLFDVKEIK